MADLGWEDLDDFIHPSMVESEAQFRADVEAETAQHARRQAAQRVATAVQQQVVDGELSATRGCGSPAGNARSLHPVRQQQGTVAMPTPAVQQQE